ncbi:tetratricopeptide repeat protein [Nostoc sp. FACHB-110]|uniref:tetratricopeptide repeat protein n=1 Tax=Nostoc sp. FACHB-110 TaxID=2692834 RepID=UPI001683046E|nr:tetratricopeptide repeat protein [Nostoc sp. FACHB-110]MBD2439689.1 tetratricopeptide repeat protein [Nostoc sp. FACHB-110]
MKVLRCLPQPEIINLSVSLGRGGEACIYAVPSDSNVVAKVYHQPTATHAKKLYAMLANPPENPTANLGHISIAWPQELIKTVDGSNSVVGFIMPRIRGMRPIIDFYNPRTRRQHCPLFNYQYLVRTARNLAAAFAALHTSGYCVGDVNESNILVSDTALVSLVDTDSFQVPDIKNNIVYRCPVGKPEFTPPELQNKVFAQHDREINHDLFGLAVLIFQLLMEGAHPFSGIFQGTAEPPPYEARIAAGHFTYSQQRKVPYVPTPIAPAWEMLHPSLQELFVQCFEAGHSNAYLRPSAQTWLSTLAEVEDALITCTTNPQHRYSNHLHSCPWCERTLRLGGRDPFPSQRAIENKEHLRPRNVPKRRYNQPSRVPQPLLAFTQSSYWQQANVPNYYPYKRSAKIAKFYPIVLACLGLGMLGYLDVMVKFTRPFVSQNAYTQQTILSQTANNQGQSFADHYQQGNDAYRVRDYKQAVESFSKAIQEEPQFAKAFIRRGNARYNLKDYEGALADYTKALQINPHEVKAFVNRGNARYMLAEYSNDPDQEYSLALADFNNAIKINVKEAEAYIRRGIVLAQIAKYSGESIRDFKRSIADFSEAIKLNASKAEAYFQRGSVYYQLAQYAPDYNQQYRLAIADFDQALLLNEKMAKVYLKRGMVRYEMAQYGGKQAEENNQKAVDDLQLAAKIALEQEDTENYQQALSSMCVIIESKCSTLLQSSSMSGYTGAN